MGGMNSGRTKGAKNKVPKLINGILYKRCVGPKCKGKYAPVSSFGKSYSYCKKCNTQRQKAYVESNFLETKVQRIRKSAKEREKKGKVCLVAPDINEIIKAKVKNQRYCYYSNIKLVEKRNDPNSWSPDRLNFNGHYLDNNIVLCTTIINSAKGRIEYSIEELINEYGEVVAIKTLKKILMTIMKYYKIEQSYSLISNSSQIE